MPTSNADEQTDAESGLNTPVKKAPPFAAEQPASANPPPTQQQQSESEREEREREKEFQRVEKAKSPAVSLARARWLDRVHTGAQPSGTRTG